MSLLELGIRTATLFCWGLSVTHFYVAIKILILKKNQFNITITVCNWTGSGHDTDITFL